MATTNFGALSASQKRVWAGELWTHGRDQNFFMSNGFVGTSSGNVIERITELTETERGRVCIMQLVGDLQSDGIVGDNLLDGQEDTLWNDAIEIRIDQIRAGLRSRGRMAEQETVIRFRTTGREKLSFWMADKLDEMMFLTLSGIAYTQNLDGSTRAANSQLPQLNFAADVAAPTSARKMFAGTATSTASLTTADKVSWNLLVSLQAKAKRERIKPIRAGGRDYYAVTMSTEQARDLSSDSNYQTIVSRAGPRSDANPLFRGAKAMVEGLVIYDHQKVPNTLGLAASSKWGSGGTVDGAQALLMGAQAMGFATIGNTDYEESDNTDYGNRPGMAVGRVIGLLKPQFQSFFNARTRQDFGVISLYTAASAT
jgi:N4-gp56 family major capsid protein